MKDIEYFTMLSVQKYISCFNGIILGKERSTTIISENNEIKYVIIEVVESKYLIDKEDRFNIKKDLKDNQIVDYYLQHMDNEDDKIKHCKLSLLGARIITSEREYKDSVYADIYIYYFNAL
jgi:acetate kinase